MILDKQYHKCIVAVSNNGTRFLVSANEEVMQLCGGVELEDWCGSKVLKNPGIFSCTIEVWKEYPNYENPDGDIDIRIINTAQIINNQGNINEIYLIGVINEIIKERIKF